MGNSIRRCLLILEGIRELHKMGFQNIRILPYIAPSGMYWRLEIIDELSHQKLLYSSGGNNIGSSQIKLNDKPESVANIIKSELNLKEKYEDVEYGIWFECMVQTAIGIKQLPWAFDDMTYNRDYWHLGDIKFPIPPNGS